MELGDLSASIDRWQVGEIDDASYATLYFMHWQSARHGKRFASRRRRTDQRPDPLAWVQEVAGLGGGDLREYLAEYVSRYQFLGIIPNVPVALEKWLRRKWPLKLCEHIPSPVEVLQMQVAGTRPVTVLSAWPRMLAPVLGKPDAFAFMVHDLEHAWKFFHSEDMHRQQRSFFRVLSSALEAGQFDPYLHDPVFAAKFDYLSSDMNTHIMHASQFLRAILVEYHLRQADLDNPDALPTASRNEIFDLMAGLLGADWLAEVERRMIPKGGTI